jgi:adenosylcobinamide-phosphate synthase
VSDHAALLLLALALDAVFGEPEALWTRVPHPAVLMGRLIGWCDARFNDGGGRKAKGIGVVLALGTAAVILGWTISGLPGGPVLEVLLAAVLLAQNSLVDHVRAVAVALRRSQAEGRRAVSMIVGRDTGSLDEAAVARAAIESAAENLSDGVVAPAFWFLIGGLPGILFYKIVNTADSMIGHRTERHGEFGWAAARLDDALNWVPARLTAMLIAAVRLDRSALGTAMRDGPRHRSVNAGWPEAAMARTLDLALSGPRSYGGQMTTDPTLNAEGRRDAAADDIDAAVSVLWRVWGGVFLTVGLVAAI